MNNNLPDSIITLSIFGSYARGDTDNYSDIDVLVVVEDGSGTAPELEIKNILHAQLGMAPSLSFYGIKKIRNMFRQGHLFAWHLYRESAAINDYPEIWEITGGPARYESAVSDVTGLYDILFDVKEKIEIYPKNALFEMGILYVCARNIAMSASWHLASGPDFGRYSPYSINQIEFPVAKADYDRMMQCRMASTRGITPPPVNSQEVLDFRHALLIWGKKVINALEAAG